MLTAYSSAKWEKNFSQFPICYKVTFWRSVVKRLFAHTMPPITLMIIPNSKVRWTSSNFPRRGLRSHRIGHPAHNRLVRGSSPCGPTLFKYLRVPLVSPTPLRWIVTNQREISKGYKKLLKIRRNESKNSSQEELMDLSGLTQLPSDYRIHGATQNPADSSMRPFFFRRFGGNDTTFQPDFFSFFFRSSKIASRS